MHRTNIVHSNRRPWLNSIGAALFLTATPALLCAQDAFVRAGSQAQSEEVTQLIATLQSPDASPYDKSVACRRLAVVGTREAVPALAALLADERLSHMARFALEPMPEPAAGAALRDAMGRLKGKLLVGVLNSIGERRDAKATDALTKLLVDPDMAVAAAAASALGRIGNPEAARAIRRALGNVPARLRPALADAGLTCADLLPAQDQRRAATAMYDALRRADLPKHLQAAALRGAILTRQSAGVPLLIEQLRSNDDDLVALALRVARELPGPDATRALVAELGKSSADRQVQIIQALGDRGDHAALPALLDAARSGAPKVRIAAIQVCSKMGDASTVPALLESAIQTDTEVAQAAQACLATLPGKEMDAVLVASLAQGDNRLRRVAIDAVAQRRVASAVPELRKASTDADHAVRLAAIKALGETVSAADLGALADILVKAGSAEDRSAAETALTTACARIPDKDACATQLLAVLPQAVPAAKTSLLQLLSQVSGGKALQAMRAAAQDADSQVKDVALRALAEWPDPAAAPDLLQLMRTTDNASYRTLAFRGYVRLSRDAETPADARLKMLTEALGFAQSADDKKRVLGGLGDVRTVESLRLVLRHLSDAGLADEAGAAVVKIVAGLDAKSNAEALDAVQRVLNSAKAQSVLDDARKQMRRLGGSQPK